MLMAVNEPYALMVQPDDILISPREVDEHFGTMVCFHPRYALGDHHNYMDKDDFLREMYGFELYKNGELSDSCWGFMGNFSDVLKDMAEYLPDECKGMVDHLEEQERPATIIKTLLKHAKIQVDQAAKAFEHASRQQVLGESR